MKGIKSRLNNNCSNYTGDDLVVDRISDLPDSILGHILSFLPTVNAVATSILSKRWKLVWVTIRSLDFSFWKDKQHITEFVHFVNRFLLLNDAGSLNKFRLACLPSSISQPQIISWINTVITKNIHELNLSVGDIDLPASLFICHSLRSLDLYGNGIVSVSGTSVVSLPRLVSLKIDHVRFESEGACENLLSGCPILQSLKLEILRSYDVHDVVTCMVSSASLRRLEIHFRNPSKLKLKASSLEYLTLRGCILEIFVEESVDSVDHAELRILLAGRDFPNNSVIDAVSAFGSVKFLSLSADVMQALSQATISLSTEFKRLEKLLACTYCCSVQDIIHNSENLEELIIYKLPIRSSTCRWTAPVEVPRCFSKSLKKVRLDGYRGWEDEREMIRYILEHGSALKVVVVIYSSVEGNGGKSELLKEICEFPKKSPACKVQFCV